MDEKFQKMAICLDKWMSLREKGVSITEYCRCRGRWSVGIYGYGKLGRHLVWELEKEGFCISWIMDQRNDKIDIGDKEYRILPPEDTSCVNRADMIIITALEDYYDIEAKLCRCTNVEIISVEQIIDILTGE